MARPSKAESKSVSGFLNITLQLCSTKPYERAIDMVVNSNSLRVIRMAELTDKVALQPSTVYALVQAGKFPVPFKIAPGGRASGWLLSDIEDWMRSRSEQGGNHE